MNSTNLHPSTCRRMAIICNGQIDMFGVCDLLIIRCSSDRFVKYYAYKYKIRVFSLFFTGGLFDFILDSFPDQQMSKLIKTYISEVANLEILDSNRKLIFFLLRE